MADTVVETIKSMIRKHLEEGNGLLFGQCVMHSDISLNALEQVPKYFLTIGWFDQFAFTIVCRVRGKPHTSARLYCVRQAHSAQGQYRTRAAEQYRHWSMFLASPDFSDNRQSFHRFSIDNCQEFASASNELLTSVIDEGLVTRNYLLCCSCLLA